MNKKRIITLLTVCMLVMSLLTVAFAAPEAAPAGDASVQATDTAPVEGEAEVLVDENGEPLPAPWYAGIVQFLPLILVVVVFYFFLIRPENKRKKEVQKMRDGLKVGDEITTIGGIIGRITNIHDEEITVETGSDRNKIRITRWAISTTVSKGANKEVKEPENKQD